MTMREPGEPDEDGTPPVDLRMDRPTSARMYDYWLLRHEALCYRAG